MLSRPTGSSEAVWGDPWLELGTGVTEFEPLDDGDDIELVAGAQGGWHLDAALRFGRTVTGCPF